MRTMARWATGSVLWAAVSAGAVAAPCAGFNDVDTADPLCSSVEWIRNRGVTLGCTATTYCPSNGVTRLQMAAFLNRLGSALTPQQIIKESALGAVPLNGPPVCVTDTAFQVSSFPRRAIVDVSLAAQAATSLDVTAVPVASLNNGPWVPLATVPARASVTAGQWGHVSAVATEDYDVGPSVRFGVQLGRAAGSGDLTGGACQLRVQVVSRDGTTSPY